MMYLRRFVNEDAATREQEASILAQERDLESVEAEFVAPPEGEFTGNPEGVWELREERRLRREDDEYLGRLER